MERLTEWKDDKKLLAKTKFDGDFGSANILTALAEYEDLEERGLLLRLPCKIGGTVFKLKRPNYCPVGICHKSISCSECRTNIPFEVVEEKFKLDELKKNWQNSISHASRSRAEVKGDEY